MNLNADQTIQKYQMLNPGDSVIVALSGGADSTALLDFLFHQKLYLLYACHINHCIRDHEADRDQVFVKELCQKYSVKLFCYTEDIPKICKLTGGSKETVGRERRYARFAELSERLNAKIATAHTLNDNMETIFFRIARGTGVGGLSGIPPVRRNIIRPFIHTSRTAIEEYCNERELSYVTDSTNALDLYTRNHIRHNILPELLLINPRIETSIENLIDSARIWKDFINVNALNVLTTSKLENGAYSAELINRQHEAVQRQVIILLLNDAGLEVSYERILSIVGKLKDKNWSMELRRNIFLCMEDGCLSFVSRNQKKNGRIRYPVLIGETIRIRNKTVEFLCYEYEHFKNIENNPKSTFKNAVDYDKICGNAVIRTRESGDRYSMPGRNWTKTLKKLYNEYHVILSERENLLVCADDSGVFWTELFGADKRVAVSLLTRNVFVIRIKQDQT